LETSVKLLVEVS